MYKYKQANHDNILFQNIDFFEQQKPLKREVEIQKLAGLFFGVALCYVDSAVFVVGLDKYCANNNSYYKQEYTPAYKMGLKWGDQLTSINDTSVDEFIN
eukprot:Pgem_evm1s15740